MQEQKTWLNGPLVISKVFTTHISFESFKKQKLKFWAVKDRLKLIVFTHWKW